HWESLRLDMPAISVRDIRVKDDSTCLCADLVAGTHGRGFWILDDITPLRQMAAVKKAAAANEAYLFKPNTAVRVRFATNDPTPWPPEVPAGENGPQGAVLDYWLPPGITGATKLEIVDAAGKTLRTFRSTDPVLEPDAYRDPVAYNKVCQRTITAPHCQFPLYWAAPSDALSNRPGAHRWVWDMRYEPLPGGGTSTTGAVPHRIYDVANAPYVVPGTYTVRLTAGGKAYTQPLTLRLDPRVKMPATALAQLNTLTKEMRDGAVATRAAYDKARALAGALESAGGADALALKAQVDSIAPPAAPGGGRGGRGFGGRGGAPQGPPNLESAAAQMMAAAMGMQSADAPPTANNVTACDRARAASKAAMAKWTALSTTGLTALNAKRKAAGQPPIEVP
ncbi:MAG TPA: hypothetical protein VG916_09425, partial [Gemmatimonadaceae bacterium]|nr:hypothetical protein [Gemmatimonadaceae bacterium]